MMPPVDPSHRSPTGQLVAAAEPLPAAEQIGDYIVTGSRSDFYTTWYVKTDNPLGPEHDFVVMAIATTQARARHVAAALACLDAASRFIGFLNAGRGPGGATHELLEAMRAYLSFADVGPG